MRKIVAQMPAGKRSRAGIFASTLTTDEKRICAGRTATNPALQRRRRLTWLLGLISDQAFRHGWSLTGCRLEFFAAHIVVRNKEVLNFAY